MSAAGGGSVTIEPFSAARADDFRRLNLEWIERYFALEPEDEAILDDPARHIIAAGGEVFFAIADDGAAIGTCAIRPVGGGRVELSKMAVTPGAQGMGVGRRLLAAALDWYRASDGNVLCLESHRSLEAAVALYEKAGFRRCERPCASAYARCDIYMEWRGDEAAPGA